MKSYTRNAVVSPAAHGTSGCAGAFSQLLHDYPDLRAIAFNGGTSARIGRKLIGADDHRLTLIDLPSSSPANTRPFAEKAAAWTELRRILNR